LQVRESKVHKRPDKVKAVVFTMIFEENWNQGLQIIEYLVMQETDDVSYCINRVIYHYIRDFVVERRVCCYESSYYC
jgi:hypothetical protein